MVVRASRRSVVIGLRAAAATACTTRCSTIRAGAKATPPRSRATSPSCNFNIFFPQTEYNGAPPNYVELELQIVPFLAAIAYKLFGVHEVFGRLIAIAFGVGTIAVVGYFARWLFASSSAGVAAMALYAIFPGSIYYSRTFQPDGAMVFFLVAALYAWSRWIVDDDGAHAGAAAWPPALLLALAFLAKQVALLALIPAAALRSRARLRGGSSGRSSRSRCSLRSSRWRSTSPFVAAHAEWHWASGIMRLHVMPSFVRGVHIAARLRTQGDRLRAGAADARHDDARAGRLRCCWSPGFCIRLRSSADAVLWGWLARRARSTPTSS